MGYNGFTIKRIRDEGLALQILGRVTLNRRLVLFPAFRGKRCQESLLSYSCLIVNFNLLTAKILFGFLFKFRRILRTGI